MSAFNGSNVKLEYYHNQSSTWHTISSSYPDHVEVEKNLLRALTRGRYQIIQGPFGLGVTGFGEDVSLNDQTGNSTINPYITVTCPKRRGVGNEVFIE